MSDLTDALEAEEIWWCEVHREPNTHAPEAYKDFCNTPVSGPPCRMVRKLLVDYPNERNRMNDDFHPSAIIPEIEAMLEPLHLADRQRVVAWLADEHLMPVPGPDWGGNS